MTHSESIHEIAAALAKAQGAMAGAKKDADNPFFKSKYADLASVWEACRSGLSANGISVVQTPWTQGQQIVVTTLLMHSSGQWISDDLTMSPKDDSPQAFGSAITYARRYALSAFVGVAPEDDDGEAAQGRPKGTVAMSVPPATKPPSDGPLVVLAPVLKKETTRKGTYRYQVSFSDGRTASTIKEQLGTLAMQLSETGEAVDAVIETGKYGPDLIELKRIVPLERAPQIAPEPVTSDSIPF